MHWARRSPVYISIIVPFYNHACKYRKVWWKQVILFYLHVTTQYGIETEIERLHNYWSSVPGRSLVVWFKPYPPPPPHFSYRATHLGHRPLVRSTFIIFRTPPFPDLATGLIVSPGVNHSYLLISAIFCLLFLITVHLFKKTLQCK